MIFVYVLKGYLLPPPAITRSVRSSGAKFLFWLVGGVVATLFAGLVVYCFNIVYDLRLVEGHYGLSIMTSFGLAGWAGFYYYICIYTVVLRSRQKRAAGAVQDAT